MDITNKLKLIEEGPKMDKMANRKWRMQEEVGEIT